LALKILITNDGTSDNMDFVQEAEKTDPSICTAIISSPEGILSANEQIINFFILYSVDGFGQTER
jgi:hypothetical protein